MAEWDDLGITKEEYDEAMSGLHDYLQESGHFDPPSDEDMVRMAAEMGVDVDPDHVETPSEYAARMKKEAALFKNMPFEQVLQYRIDHKMVLTDADKRLINEKIVDEYESMTEEYDGTMAYYDAEIDGADARVERYASNQDAQREVAGCGGNVPAWMMHEYPIDERGRAYTADELRDQYEQAREDHTNAYEAARDKLFARVYDLHVLTTKRNALPMEVTGDKTASPVITPSTFRVLGDEFSAYHAEQIRQRLPGDKSGSIDWKAVKSSMDAEKQRVIGQASGGFDDVEELPLTVSGSLPVVDFSKSVANKPVQPQKDVQSQIVAQQTINPGKKQSMSDLDIERQEAGQHGRADGAEASGRRGRMGVKGFADYENGNNSLQGGRSNPDYDFDDYD